MNQPEVAKSQLMSHLLAATIIAARIDLNEEASTYCVESKNTPLKARIGDGFCSLRISCLGRN